jgi:CRISPR/Cas system-associated protein Cas7 (RAMP superfamily)
MIEHLTSDIYEMSFVIRVAWQAHSLSNAGSNGSIRTMARRQLLADGTETDACTGNIAKHHHAALLLEYFSSCGVPVCSACRVHDGRRAFALQEKDLDIQKIINGCGVCDCHGFLIPPKNANESDNSAPRAKTSKSSLLEYSMALAIPGSFSETTQLYTRLGDGQMLMKMPARSGQYALCVRYRTTGVGVDTERWQLIVKDQSERTKRHQAILFAIRDQLMSPDGALTAKLLPHLTGFEGVIMVRNTPGRAPFYSPLETDYRQQLMGLSVEGCEAYQFDSITQFDKHMNFLAHHTSPSLPPFSQDERK